MDIKKEIKDYLHYCKYQKRLSELSVKAYSIDLEQFICHLTATSNNNLTKAAVSLYIIELHQKYRPQTVKRKLASLRAFLNYLEFEEILEANPIRKIRMKFQEPKVLPKVIPLSVIEKVLAAAYRKKGPATTIYSTFIGWMVFCCKKNWFKWGWRE